MRCAILLAGSLLWDSGKNGERDAWRETRLTLANKVQVKAPLYYGRKSQSRGNTFTMTLGTDDSLARGILAPCTASIDTIDELMDEISALWLAEAPTAPRGSFHKGWGCVGALFGTNATKSGLADQWKTRFHAAKSTPPSAIDADGRLNIPWPRTVDDQPITDFDVILATATRPEGARPDAATIAKAWIEQDGGHERYFFENVRHGIRTPDDGDIWQIFEERTPRWLKPGAYEQAVDILRAEAKK